VLATIVFLPEENAKALADYHYLCAYARASAWFTLVQYVNTYLKHKEHFVLMYLIKFEP